VGRHAELRARIAADAAAARAAAAALTDTAVAAALRGAARLVGERIDDLLKVNAAECEAGARTLDAGTIDRLRLDERRVAQMGEQLESAADAPPLERELDEWTLPNGLRVSERRVPVGCVGANFEARPNVALDVAAQLLKSLNGGVLRTGGAALRTSTFLVDEVVRSGLAEAGLDPAAIAIVRSRDRAAARALVSLPHEIPLVILRGSGAGTAALARHAARHGVRALAHAEGGGVLYVHPSASPKLSRALVEASLDRLGVCNRLNLLLVDAGAVSQLDGMLAVLAERGLEVYGTKRAAAHADVVPHRRPLGHEWASDPSHVESVTLDVVDGVEEAARIANEETSGLAAGIAALDGDAAERFLELYRGSAGFWNAPTRFADGYELTGSAETGINVDWSPGPRGPVTYRDLALRQYRVVGDGTQRR
jgi:glutamate-5-semialdehyde dehydrogenase